MTTWLSPELERFVQSEVESGHFASREAVIEAALWDMQQRRLLDEADEDFETGNVVRFRSVVELRAHAEDVKVRGRSRIGEQTCQVF